MLLILCNLGDCVCYRFHPCISALAVWFGLVSDFHNVITNITFSNVFLKRCISQRFEIVLTSINAFQVLNKGVIPIRRSLIPPVYSSHPGKCISLLKYHDVFYVPCLLLLPGGNIDIGGGRDEVVCKIKDNN